MASINYEVFLTITKYCRISDLKQTAILSKECNDIVQPLINRNRKILSVAQRMFQRRLANGIRDRYTLYKGLGYGIGYGKTTTGISIAEKFRTKKDMSN